MTKIERIHHEIDTAQDRLLTEANLVLENNPRLAEKLAAIGFKTPSVDSLQSYKTIQYYTQTYPFLKFITEDELNRICKKYDLIINPIENYIGEVPEKNADEILNAQPLKDKDGPHDLKYSLLKKDNRFMIFPGSGWTSIWGKEWYRIPKRIDGEHFINHFHADDWLHKNMGFSTEYLVKSVENYIEKRTGLFICAPKVLFRGKNKSIVKMEDKDPIVFRYVRGGVQIITKWGIESSDETLVNPKSN